MNQVVSKAHIQNQVAISKKKEIARLDRDLANSKNRPDYAEIKQQYDEMIVRIEEKYESGVVFEGWEVKAIRAGRVQLKEAYVTIRNS